VEPKTLRTRSVPPNFAMCTNPLSVRLLELDISNCLMPPHPETRRRIPAAVIRFDLDTVTASSAGQLFSSVDRRRSSNSLIRATEIWVSFGQCRTSSQNARPLMPRQPEKLIFFNGSLLRPRRASVTRIALPDSC
jgi:hypothetical protein